MKTKMDIPDKEGRKRLVIVGGGFGGLKLARKLKSNKFQIVLLDKNKCRHFLATKHSLFLGIFFKKIKFYSDAKFVSLFHKESRRNRISCIIYGSQ